MSDAVKLVPLEAACVGVRGISGDTPVYEVRRNGATIAEHLTEPDAKLFVAAGDMYAALTEIATFTDSISGQTVAETDPALALNSIIARAKAAIAKVSA